MRGNPINTVGDLPAVGSPAPAFTLTGSDLAPVSNDQFSGKSVLLNIFPSVDTPVCATSVRTFNERAAAGGVSVLCVSNDLPFAQARFCGAEGIENVQSASSFRDSFGQDYGVTIADGPFAGLLARAVVVIGADGNVAYEELVPEIAQEPNYDAALAALGASSYALYLYRRTQFGELLGFEHAEERVLSEIDGFVTGRQQASPFARETDLQHAAVLRVFTALDIALEHERCDHHRGEGDRRERAGANAT